MPDLGVIAHAAEQVVRDARRAAAAPGDFVRALAVNLHVQQARRADDDFLQICGHVIIQPFAHGKAREQRRGEQSAARGRADEREARKIQPHAARVRPLVNDDVEFEVLHRRVQIFLDGFLQAMDFVNEQHVAFLEVRQQAGEVAGFLDGRAAGAFEVRAHGLGEDVSERGFTQAGRTAEQDVVERFAPLFRRLHGDSEALLDLELAGEFGKERGAQRHFQRRVRFVQSGNRAFVHHRKDEEMRRKRQGKCSGLWQFQRGVVVPRNRGAIPGSAGVSPASSGFRLPTGRRDAGAPRRFMERVTGLCPSSFSNFHVLAYL